MVDLILKNGLICDGTGSMPFTGDVAIRNGKILALAPGLVCDGAEMLDVSGLVVSPAFIDMHSHSDSSFLLDERCESKIHQGVATEVAGQCGSSPFPRNQDQMIKLNEAIAAGKRTKRGAYQAASFEELLRKRTTADRMSTNLVQMVGHNAIRQSVAGLVGRPARKDEIELSSRLLEENLAQGAWGLSLGLEYMPGIFAQTEELEALARVCSAHGVVITSHMREEGKDVFHSIEEMIALSRCTGARIHISHLKLRDQCVWGQAEKLYQRICDARAEGISITADIYPYNACSTSISIRLPRWAMDGGSENAYRMLAQPGPDRERILAYFQETLPARADGDRIYIVSTAGRFPEADDRTIGELSESWGMTVPDALVKFLTETRCEANCIFFNMNEGDVHFLLRRDLAIGSDSSARPFDPAANDGKPHPRSYGTFPRFLRLRRELDLCPLETAIHRITQEPAEIVGLKDRGVLAPGMIADIAVFNERIIGDTATYADPFQKPIGMNHVIMNGGFALRDGVQTNLRLGDYLLRRA